MGYTKNEARIGHSSLSFAVDWRQKVDWRHEGYIVEDGERKRRALWWVLFEVSSVGRFVFVGAKHRVKHDPRVCSYGHHCNRDVTL